MRRTARGLVPALFFACCMYGTPVRTLSAQSPPTPAGCFFFNRPISHSASGDLERGDSSWYTLELLTGGRVARPQLRRSDYWNRNSSWRARGDTLLVRVFTGLVGWDLTLLPDGNSYSGTGQYLTDVIVRGAEPLRAPFRAIRVACPLPPPTQPEPMLANLRSTDSTQHPLIRIKVIGRLLQSLGIASGNGTITLQDSTGTARGVLAAELALEAGDLTFSSDRDAPELELRIWPRSGAATPRYYARGHSVRVARARDGILYVMQFPNPIR